MLEGDFIMKDLKKSVSMGLSSLALVNSMPNAMAAGKTSDVKNTNTTNSTSKVSNIKKKFTKILPAVVASTPLIAGGIGLAYLAYNTFATPEYPLVVDKKSETGNNGKQRKKLEDAISKYQSKHKTFIEITEETNNKITISYFENGKQVGTTNLPSTEFDIFLMDNNSSLKILSKSGIYSSNKEFFAKIHDLVSKKSSANTGNITKSTSAEEKSSKQAEVETQNLDTEKSGEINYIEDETPNIVDFKRVCEDVKDLLSKNGNLVKITGKTYVFGDIHGNAESLKKAFVVAKKAADEGANVVFLGDYVDRGPKQLNVVYNLFRLKKQYPDKVFLLRGDHELESLKGYGFANKCKQGYKDEDMYEKSILPAFRQLPFAAVVDNDYLLVHGGISEGLHSLSDIEKINKDTFNRLDVECNFKHFNNLRDTRKLIDLLCSDEILGGMTEDEKQKSIEKIKEKELNLAATLYKNTDNLESNLKDKGITIPSGNISKLKDYIRYFMIQDLLWSDPNEDAGTYGIGGRGSGCIFSSKALEAKFRELGLKCLIRGHEQKKLPEIDPYSINCEDGGRFSKHCYTVFSTDFEQSGKSAAGYALVLDSNQAEGKKEQYITLSQVGNDSAGQIPVGQFKIEFKF